MGRLTKPIGVIWAKRHEVELFTACKLVRASWMQARLPAHELPAVNCEKHFTAATKPALPTRV